MIISRITVLVRAALACLAFLTAHSWGGILSSEEQAVFDHLHASARPFIVVDPILTRVARARAQDMAKRHFFDHVNPDGHGPNYMVRAAGYKLPDYWGNSATDNFVESIAAGQSTASDVWSAWMASPPHKKHLMAQDAFYAGETSVGVGFYKDPNSDYDYYWVVISAPPQPEPDLSIISPTPGQQVNGPQVALSGKTGGNGDAAHVLYRVENSAGTSAFTTASGIDPWSGAATGLVPGPNTIRVRSLDDAGVTIAELVRTVVYVVLSPLTTGVSGDGTITSGFDGTTQRGLGITYTVVATPNAGSLFLGWSGSITSKNPRLSFVMAAGETLTAGFVPNPFLTLRGGYSGLLQGETAGSISVAVNSVGIFTGRLILGDGSVLVLRGHMGADGAATVDLPGNLHLALNLDVSGGGAGVSGSLSGAENATFTAATTYRPADGDYANAGRYTVSMPPDPNSTDATLPQGNGFGTLSVTKTGRARLVGALADGRTFSTVASVTSGDNLPVYLRLYGRSGHLGGNLAIHATDVSDLDGQVHWSKPELARARIHPDALETDLPVVGSKYVSTATAASMRSTASAPAPETSLTLTDGNLTQPLVENVTLAPVGRATASVPRGNVRAIVNPATGLFTGSFRHPVTQKVSTFRGVMFQKQNAGFGYFLGSDESGNAALAGL